MLSNSLKTMRGLLNKGECVSSYVIEGNYYCSYCITPEEKDIDISGAIEDTLHRLLDLGFGDDDIFMLTGMTKSPTPEGMCGTEVDLGYRLHGLLLTFTHNIIGYEEAVKSRKPYLLRNYTPGNTTQGVIIAENEELAIREIQAYYPNSTGWYAELIEPSDGLRIVS